MRLRTHPWAKLLTALASVLSLGAGYGLARSNPPPPPVTEYKALAVPTATPLVAAPTATSKRRHRPPRLQRPALHPPRRRLVR